MDFFSKRTVIRNAGFPELPGEINLLALMGAEEFHLAFFDVPEKATRRKDSIDIFGEVLKRFFKRVDAGLQIILLFEKAVGPFRRANKFMHKKEIVSTAVGLFSGPEKFQAFFKLRQ